MAEEEENDDEDGATVAESKRKCGKSFFCRELRGPLRKMRKEKNAKLRRLRCPSAFLSDAAAHACVCVCVCVHVLLYAYQQCTCMHVRRPRLEGLGIRV